MWKNIAMRERVGNVCNRELGIRNGSSAVSQRTERRSEHRRMRKERYIWSPMHGQCFPVQPMWKKGKLAMDSVDKYLFTPYGILLNAPSYTVPDDDIGFVTRVYPGLKENGSIFSPSESVGMGSGVRARTRRPRNEVLQSHCARIIRTT